MIPIQRIKPFKVIHWDYTPFNSPVPVQIQVKQNLKLNYYPIPLKDSQENRALYLEWRFKYIYSDGSIRLSYIAEDYFLVTNYKEASDEYITEVLKQSYSVFNLEFNERKQGSDLRVNYLDLFEKLAIQPKPILDSLQEPFLEKDGQEPPHQEQPD